MCNILRKVTCPNPKCNRKIDIKIGKDNGDSWALKEMTCPSCQHHFKYEVNSHEDKIRISG